MEPRRIHLGLDAWIIQDGNYGDFRLGESVNLAIEFYPHSHQVTDRREPSATLLKSSRYLVRGRVVFADQAAWVLDFGFLAYQDHTAPSGIGKGDWIEAEVYLGVDPFFYFETLYARQGMPDLQYPMRVRSILSETTPWLTSTDQDGRKSLRRDASRESFIEVAETNAWSDDDGHANYILECEFLGLDPIPTRKP